MGIQIELHIHRIHSQMVTATQYEQGNEVPYKDILIKFIKGMELQGFQITDNIMITEV